MNKKDPLGSVAYEYKEKPNSVTPEGVLESLMNDGTIDAIRLKIINQLKANVAAAPLCSVSQARDPSLLRRVWTPTFRRSLH
ncbi:hypothetical protein Taro_018786 [Colocasia esculenta]|uniref:Uncharacterized protein n=1 Tax=Colocasia esculenta TaxID=4460 RepID=A0A843UJH7_COLES|nr:hypothetical protein [Colocasia esculenta]